MFCWKCGKEIPDDASFCSGCGTKQEMGRKAFTFENIHSGNVKISLPERNQVAKCMNRLGASKVYFFSVITGLVLALLFLNGEMFEVTFEFLSTRVERFTMFDGRDFLKFVCVAGHLLSVVVLLFPVVTGKQWKGWNLYPAVVVPVFSVLSLLIIMASAKNQMADSWMMEAVEAKASLTTGGWFFLLISVATVFLAIKTVRVLSDIQEIETEDREIQDTQPPYWCAMCEMEGPFENEICPKCGSKSKKYFRL